MRSAAGLRLAPHPGQLTQVTTPGMVPHMAPHQLDLFAPDPPPGVPRCHVGTVGGMFVDMDCCRLLLVVPTGSTL